MSGLAWYLIGVATLPAAVLAWAIAHDAAQAATNVRFYIGAQWDLRKRLSRDKLPWLWRWPADVVRMWCRELWLSDNTDTTSITFKDGSVYRRGRWGKPVWSDLMPAE